MIPKCFRNDQFGRSFPRIGGGDPKIFDNPYIVARFSPHRRGVILALGVPSGLTVTFPRIGGGIPSLNPDFREFVRIAESKKIMYKFYNIPRDKNNIFEGFTSRCLKRNAV